MLFNYSRVVSTTLLLAGVGAVATAAPSFHSPLKKVVKAVQQAADETPKPYQWAMPSIIQAGLVQKELSLSLGDTFASYEGRTFNVKQGQVSLGVTDRIQLLYGEQYFLAKGRASTSRFDEGDNYYAIRGVVKPPTTTDPTALSLQFEAIKPDTGSVVEGNSYADFPGTHNNVFSVNYLDRQQDQLQLQYTDVTAPGGLYANVYSLGFGHDYQLSEFVLARVQGSVVGENYQGAGNSSNFELRPIVTADFAVNPTPWLALEADLTAMPAGIPLAGGELTGLTSFFLYNPGGVIQDLHDNFVGFASLRLVFHGKF